MKTMHRIRNILRNSFSLLLISWSYSIFTVHRYDVLNIHQWFRGHGESCMFIHNNMVITPATSLTRISYTSNAYTHWFAHANTVKNKGFYIQLTTLGTYIWLSKQNQGYVSKSHELKLQASISENCFIYQENFHYSTNK